MNQYDLPAPIRAYLDAYNAMDVPAMLACLAEGIRFENRVGGQLSAETTGKAAFERLALMGASAFSTRTQTVREVETHAGKTRLEIDFTAIVAGDMPNGWTAGQTLAFSGRSTFDVENGLIVRIVDES